MTKEDYKRYLDSTRWASIREERLSIDHNLCQNCGGPAKCVHHLNYFRVGGEENIEHDLISLCFDCHKFVHGYSNFNPAEETIEE